jgi:hypothetical protein
MELLVLSTLEWRMQAVTPFSYIDYFLHRLNGGDAPSRRSVVRSADLILCIARGAGIFQSQLCYKKSLIVSLDLADNFSAVRVAGTQCLDFRPSEIAAAVATVVAAEERAADIDEEACTHRVHKVRVSVTQATFDASQRTPDLHCNVLTLRATQSYVLRMLQPHLSRHHDTRNTLLRCVNRIHSPTSYQDMINEVFVTFCRKGCRNALKRSSPWR